MDLFYEEKGKRETSSKKILGVYRAERLIATKQDADETKYLVKWEGYSSFENTWEPEEHLSPLLLRYFASPKPELAIIQENVDRLRHGILECLRHKELPWSSYMMFSNIYFTVKEGNRLKKTGPYMNREISANAKFLTSGIVCLTNMVMGTGCDFLLR